MKLSLNVNGINKTLKALKMAEVEIKENFKGEIVNYGIKIKQRAKEVLSEESQKRTNQKYWTGALYDSINSNIIEREGEVVGISVGPDLRQAPYAEWVEIGHYLVSGDFGSERGAFWEGYHFLEKAYTEISPLIPSQITKTLKVNLNHFDQGSRTRNRTTGRFVKGFSIQ